MCSYSWLLLHRGPSLTLRGSEQECFTCIGGGFCVLISWLLTRARPSNFSMQQDLNRRVPSRPSHRCHVLLFCLFLAKCNWEKSPSHFCWLCCRKLNPTSYFLPRHYRQVLTGNQVGVCRYGRRLECCYGWKKNSKGQCEGNMSFNNNNKIQCCFVKKHTYLKGV